jgi:hypothetical protein
MSETNGFTIRNPLINIVCKDEGNVLLDKILSCSILEYDSLVGLKRAFDAADVKAGSQHVFLDVCQDSKCDVIPMKMVELKPLFSMKISNHLSHSLILCPGHAAFGKQGLWRLSQSIEEKKSENCVIGC